MNPPSTSTPEGLIGKDLILPTRDTRITIEELLGSVEKEFLNADIRVPTVIEYILNTYLDMQADEDVYAFTGSSVEKAVKSMVLVDFAFENPMAATPDVDQIGIQHGLRLICYYVFSEIIPLIRDMGLTPQQLASVQVVKWMGSDLVIRANPPSLTPSRIACATVAEIDRNFAKFLLDRPS